MSLGLRALRPVRDLAGEAPLDKLGHSRGRKGKRYLKSESDEENTRYKILNGVKRTASRKGGL